MLYFFVVGLDLYNLRQYLQEESIVDTGLGGAKMAPNAFKDNCVFPVASYQRKKENLRRKDDIIFHKVLDIVAFFILVYTHIYLLVYLTSRFLKLYFFCFHSALHNVL